MELYKWKSICKNKIQDTQHRSVFDTLLATIQNTDIKNAITVIIARYKRTQSQNIINIISQEEASRVYDKINLSILTIIDNLSADDLKKELIIIDNEGFHYQNKILIISEDDKSQKELKKYFDRFKFKNVTIRSFEQKPEFLNDFEIVIFDNRDLYDDEGKIISDIINENREERMNYFLNHNHSSAYLIHLGNRSEFINKNRNKIQAANSLISLYSRTKELIEFIHAI